MTVRGLWYYSSYYYYYYYYNEIVHVVQEKMFKAVSKQSISS